MDERVLLLAMAERLYQDIKFVTEQSPVQIVDEDGARAYNTLLARVRTHFSSLPTMSDFQEWSPRSIKYKDALIVAGQLHAMVKTVVEPVRQPAPAAAPYSPSPSDSFQNRGGIRPQTSTGVPRRPSPAAPPSSDSVRGQSYTPVSEQTPNPTSERTSRSSQHTPLPDRDSFDSDLYGSSQPPKRNDDGTIPFTLD
ncbi:MAG: hypothetical protein JJU11_09950 [Candidatus Sumerlaeia bacterium]|nr:hypothetical protein [Candidatus Sumerlaeia bacterium]